MLHELINIGENNGIKFTKVNTKICFCKLHL